LHLEDDPFDAELIQRILSAEGITCDVVRVDTQERFAAELATGDYDIVLSDYALPSFDGMTALAITRQNKQDIPFILISGTVGEEVAVEALKSGATDYIIKQRISRLPFAVRRALQEARERADRKNAEEQRHTAEVKFRNLVENLPGIVYLAEFGARGKWLYVSPPVKSILGYSPAEIIATAGLWTKLIHPEDRERVLTAEAESLKAGEQFVSEYRMHARDGRIIWLRDEGSVLHDPPLIQGVMLDITRVKNAEEEKGILEKQYREAQKMEAIGRLAGGLAHDFNNLLMAVDSYCELMHLQLTVSEERLNEPLKEIQKIIEQGSRLTRQLLAFSRNQIQEKRILDLNEIIRNMEKILQRLVREDVELRMQLQESLWPVKTDQGQIEQVVINLAVNARDAMPQGGTLTIRTFNTEKDTRFENGFVTLEVIDTGSGIESDIVAHIFEPFFTTKERAGGTGLGLAMVYGIVKQSGGEIQVSSELGRGTTFSIALPRA
jgi:two-component system cell cycle sensor histidine kinase/response regulator CckA